MTKRTNCQHEHGATIKAWDLWVCGQCYAKLPERPKRYGPPGNGPGSAPQTIIWQAEVRTVGNYSLSNFLHRIAVRLIMRGKATRLQAYDLALDALKGMGVEFGDPSHSWDAGAAITIADEEMTYWEQDSEGSNS